MHVGSDLCAGTDGRPRIHHGVGTHVGTDVDVTGHHDHTRALIAAPPGRRTGNHPDPTGGIVDLERNLVGELERADLDGRHLCLAEQQQDGKLQPLVDHHPTLAVGFGDTGLAGIQQVDGTVNCGVGAFVVGIQRIAGRPDVLDLCAEV